MKFGDKKWEKVQSARCNSDKFTGILVDGGIIEKQPVPKVKCARRSKLPKFIM